MKLKPLKRAPVLLAVAVLAVVCGARLAHWDFPERLERMTYDLRVRTAQKFPAPFAPNLAFVSMEDSSIKAVQSGKLGYSYGLFWPRQVYGRLVEELSAEGAKAVAFDVLFGEVRHDHPPVMMANGSLMESDDFFALQMRRAANVLMGVTPEVMPPDLFATNALALGDISTEKDSDGVLRRVRAFHDYRRWHPLFQKAAAEFDLDLTNALVAPGRIILPQTGTTNTVIVPVDADNHFDLTNFVGDRLPPGWPAKARAFTDERVWDMGIVLAAQDLKLDLHRAAVDLAHGKITLRRRGRAT